MNDDILKEIRESGVRRDKAGKSVKVALTGLIGVCVVVVLGGVIGYSTVLQRREVLKDADNRFSAEAGNLAGHVEVLLAENMASARTLAKAFSDLHDPAANMNMGRDQIAMPLRTVLEEHEVLEGIFTVWEPGAFDELDELYAGAAPYDATGRFACHWTRTPDGEVVRRTVDFSDAKTPVLQAVAAAREHGREIAWHTTIPRSSEDREASIMLVVPIQSGGEFLAAVGVVFPRAALQNLLEDAWSVEKSAATLSLVSSDLVCVAAAGAGGADLVGEMIQEGVVEHVEEHVEIVREGRALAHLDGEDLDYHAPVRVGRSGMPWSVSVRMPQDVVLAQASVAAWRQIGIGGALTVVALLVVGAVVQRQMRPLGPLAETAEAAAEGDLRIPDIQAPDNEIGLVYRGFQRVVASFSETAEVCEAVSRGDFSRMVLIRGDRDVLGRSINRMVETLRGVLAQARAISEGDYSLEIAPQSSEDELGVALCEMTRKLREFSRESELRSWAQTGQTGLDAAMRGEREGRELLQEVVAHLAKYLDAAAGAVFLAENETLRLVASYAYERRKSVDNTFAFGEGCVGQAALERRPILLSNVPEDYMAVRSGLGGAAPRSILVLPIVREDEVLAVLELGFFDDCPQHKLEFLKAAAPSVAAALHSALSRGQMRELLQRTQTQAEELQTQQEELRQTNEELEEQTHALRDSQARLETQQEELAQTNEELEERTEALERERNAVNKKNDELEAARRMVEDKARELTLSSKYKSEFLANMSHELRTPLNSMLILSKLLMDNKNGRLDEKDVEFARTINQSGAELLALINEILDLSKIEAGRMEMSAEEVRLDEFVAGLERKFRPVAEDKGLDFRLDVAPDAPVRLETDGQRLGQILKNLLSNALKFTESGSVQVEIARPGVESASWKGLDPARSVLFTVRDTGPGIPADKQNLIFEAFQQADGTTVRKYGGTGLGLSISRELANLLGGEIHLESEKGKGSAFSVLLPETGGVAAGRREADAARLPEEKPAPPVSAPSPNLTPEPAASSAGETRPPEDVPPPRSGVEAIPDDRRDMKPGDRAVLIVADDAEQTRLLMDLARERDFRSLVSPTIDDALHLADYYAPSAVVVDADLDGGADGMRLVALLKDNPRTRHIPVHVISEGDDQLDARRLGAASVIDKPVSLHQVQKSLQGTEHLIERPVRDLLLVEDDPATRMSVQELLCEDDVRIRTASTAAAALDALRDGRYDCMVLDLGLPDLPGLKLLERIRADETIPDLPIIVFTGKELDGEEQRTLDRYAQRVILKGEKSPERLLDETALFLHRVEAEMPDEKRRMIRMLHNKEAIFKDKRVLLVDDDMRNLFALSAVLEDKGMRPVMAKNGREALEKLDAPPGGEAFDLVLMDIMMPEMDGYEAMRRIRERPDRRRDVPIIALTAKAMKGDRGKCIEAGASDYLAKPVDTDKLLSMLRVWLYR